MTLNSMEVNLIREILTKHPADTWGQFSRQELMDLAKEAGVITALDQRRFPDKCNQLGIGSGAH